MAESIPSQYTIMTNAGTQIAAQLLASKNRIKSFRAVGSDTQHYTDDPETVAALTNIDSVKQNGTIAAITEEGNNAEAVQIDFNQSQMDADYQLATVGLFATDENGKEILYAVECLQHPQYMAKSTSNDVNTQLMHIVVGKTENVNLTVSPAGSVSTAQLNAILADYVKTDALNKLLSDSGYATEKYVDDKVANIPQPDTSSWQKHKLTADDGSAKLVVASGEDVNTKLGGVIGQADIGTVSIDIGAKNNAAGHTLLGLYQSTATTVNTVLQTSANETWSLSGVKSDSGTTFTWLQLVDKAYVDKAVADAKQAAIDQAKADLDAEMTKRNVPSLFWTGTEDAFSKIDPKDPNADYRTQEDDS